MYLILTVILPATTGFLFISALWIRVRGYYDELRMRKLDISELRSSKRAKLVIISFMFIVPVIYGLISYVLIMMNLDGIIPVQQRALDSGVRVLSSSLVIGLISTGSLIHLFLRDYLGERERTSEEMANWAKRQRTLGPFGSLKDREGFKNPYMNMTILMQIPHTIAIYGLMILLLTMSFSGMMGGDGGNIDNANDTREGTGEYSIDLHNIERVESSSWIYVGLSLLSVSSGFLPYLRKGSFTERKIFLARAGLSFAGTTPVIAGFMLMIIAFSL